MQESHDVSADLKRIQFGRSWWEPGSSMIGPGHTNASTAAEGEAVTTASFFPATDRQFMGAAPAPPHSKRNCGSGLSLVSLLTDSMTRYSWSALLTFPDTQ